MASIEQVVDDVFGRVEQSKKSTILELMSAAGVRTASDIAVTFEDPENVRQLLGRPLPSYMSKPLRQRGLIPPFSPAGDPYAGGKYLRKKEDLQSRTTGYIIQTVFAGVDIGVAAREQLPSLLGLLPKELKDPRESYEAYEGLVHKMSSILPIQYDKVTATRPKPITDNASELFRFRSGKGNVMWMLAAGTYELEDAGSVGGLMSAMDDLFSEEPLRHFAFGAVTLMDYVWVFKCIPESFEPVACLYQLLHEGGLETIAKLMCAPPSLYGVE